MIFLNKLVVMILSAVMALGTINPFFSVSTSEMVSESILLPLFAVLFILITLVANHRKLNVIANLKLYSIPLIAFVSLLFIADFIYSPSDINLYFFGKLTCAILFFIFSGWYFSINSKMIEVSMMIYAITCSLIVVALYLGLIDNFVLISNGRLRIFGENSNSTSSRMSISIVFYLYFIMNKQYANKYKSIFLIMSLLILFYIIQSGSRGSLLSTMLAVACVLFFSKVNFKVKVMALSFILCLSIFFLPRLSNMENIGMFTRLSQLEEGNVRSKLMKQALEIYYDHPLIGCGANGYEQEKTIRSFDSSDSHCILTSIMAMGGTLCLFFFLIFLHRLLKFAMKVRRRSIIPVLMILVMLFISLKTGGVLTYILMWYVYSISFSLTNKLIKDEHSIIGSMECRKV